METTVTPSGIEHLIKETRLIIQELESRRLQIKTEIASVNRQINQLQIVKVNPRTSLYTRKITLLLSLWEIDDQLAQFYEFINMLINNEEKVIA